MMSGPSSSPIIDIGPASLSRLDAATGRTLAAAMARIDPWARMGYPEAALAASLAATDAAAPRYAIVRDGAVAGVTAVRQPWLKGPYLELLALLPAFQGRGIGAAVVAWMARTAPADARNLWVVASAFNVRAIAFYQRHGFEAAAALPDLVTDGYTEILLRKRVAPAGPD